MGKGIVEQLKKEFDIEDTWLNYEIHPETPLEGIALADMFKGADVSAMQEQIRQSGKQYGITFNDMDWLSNSRKAIAASEYAKDHGKFHEFHGEVFKTFFEEGKDIGKESVLIKAAQAVGLATADLDEVFQKNIYKDRLDANIDMARQYEVTGTPTFIINDKFKIVGAQPIDSFRKGLEQIIQINENEK